MSAASIWSADRVRNIGSNFPEFAAFLCDEASGVGFIGGTDNGVKDVATIELDEKRFHGNLVHPDQFPPRPYGVRDRLSQNLQFSARSRAWPGRCATRPRRYLNTSSNQSNSIWCLRLGLFIWQWASPPSTKRTRRSVFGQVSFS